MKKALLIIDVQKSSVTDFIKVAKIEKLQYEYDTVFVSKFENKGSYLIKFRVFEGYEDEELAFLPKKNSNIFSKTGYSSFIPKMRDFDEIDICGFDTDACVYKTAMDFIEAGIKPCILINLCGSQNDEFHKIAVKLLERNIGKKCLNYSLF